MTDYVKIIPCLDTKDGRLVKGVNFVNLKDIADPAEMAEQYSKAGADELVLLDITATIEGRTTLLDAVKRTVAVIDIPLTVGGGIRTLDNMRELFDLGVSKCSINTAAVKNPQLISDAASEFGSERITVAIDTRRNSQMRSGFEVVVDGGRTPVGRDAIAWAKECELLGAGAILPTSMDADGTQAGYDIPMTRAIAEAVSIPVIASGGAGNLDHLVEAVVDGKASAVLVASIFHYGTYTISQAKEYMASKGIKVKLCSKA
ncbi:MAG: imidazole glycerol phosphate synthase subunit HisF [Armatimonadetes bacterium]|nr:imidazole glycerol phosphate synthase subunit HisF [Armatimonadota bacterium]